MQSTYLENKPLFLHTGVAIILDVKDQLSKCNGRVTELTKIKMALVLKKDQGFKTLLKTPNIINEEYDKELKILILF